MHSIVSLQPVVNHRTDFDHASKILRLSGTYQRRFLDDPKPDRDQVGAQNVRQIILGVDKVLDKGVLKLADKTKRLDGFPRLRACTFGPL